MKFVIIHIFKIIIFIINILLCRNLSLITTNPLHSSAYILEHICLYCSHAIYIYAFLNGWGYRNTCN